MADAAGPETTLWNSWLRELIKANTSESASPTIIFLPFIMCTTLGTLFNLYVPQYVL